MLPAALPVRRHYATYDAASAIITFIFAAAAIDVNTFQFSRHVSYWFDICHWRQPPPLSSFHIRDAAQVHIAIIFAMPFSLPITDATAYDAARRRHIRHAAAADAAPRAMPAAYYAMLMLG